MATAKSASNRKRKVDPELTKLNPLSPDLDFSIDIRGIMSALHQIRDKAHKDGLMKKEETISSVAAEFKSMIDELKSKVEKDRQSFAKSLSKNSNECENCLKAEAAKFQALYEKFCKDQANHLLTLKGIVSQYEEEKERLCMRYEQLRKRERSLISGHEKACAEKIVQLEESLKKKKQDDRTFSVLRKSLGSFLESASDEDIPADI